MGSIGLPMAAFAFGLRRLTGLPTRLTGSCPTQVGHARYADLAHAVPLTERLNHVIERMLPYSESDIAGSLKTRKTVLATASASPIERGTKR